MAHLKIYRHFADTIDKTIFHPRHKIEIKYGKGCYLYDFEGNEYLDFAILEAKQPIKKVIIGLDFFGSLTYTPIVAKEPHLILDKTLEPFYRYKLLFSLDTLIFSMHNFNANHPPVIEAVLVPPSA